MRKKHKPKISQREKQRRKAAKLAIGREFTKRYWDSQRKPS